MSSNYYTYGTNLRNKEFFTSTVKTSSGIKRFFSNIDADIYFGDKKIEDMVEFQFSVEEQKLPIFSYNKFYADVIVPGQRIVQGTFAINFTSGEYMSNVLSEIPDSVYNEIDFDEQKYNPGGDKKNSAIYNKNFDITLCYGDYKEESPSYNATVQTICGVQINNTGVALSAKTGEPILEVYSFIAKDFIDNIVDSGNGSSGNSGSNNSNSNSNNKDNSNGSNKGNSSSGNSNKEIEKIINNFKYKATYSKANTVPTLTVMIENTQNVSNKILSSCSSTAIVEITDKDIKNYKITGYNGTNFSTKTTLQGKYFKDKTDDSVESMQYAVDIDLSKNSGQGTRPINKKMNAYFTKNPSKTASATISFTLKVDGKTIDVSKDISINYSTSSTIK